MVKEKLLHREISVRHGLRGFYAVLLGTFEDQNDKSKITEPIMTGVGSYKTSKKAWEEAHSWAESEGIKCMCPNCKENDK